GTQVAQLWLECADHCPADAGAPARDARSDAPASDALPACGNGVLDEGEVCDTGIARGKPGACPTTCDDGISCTIDTRIGSGCTAECTYTEIRACVPGDGCCPAHGTHEGEPDCAAACGTSMP